MVDFIEDKRQKGTSAGSSLGLKFEWVSYQSGHPSAPQGWTLPAKCFYGAIMTAEFDSSKMHHWANIIVSSTCQELLLSVI